MRRADLIRVIARALVDGPWFYADIVKRLEMVVEQPTRAWMKELAEVVCARFELAPSETELAQWLLSEDARGRDWGDDDELEDDELDESLGDVEEQATTAEDVEPAFSVHEIFRVAMFLGTRIRRWPMPAPAMRESPWRVPALATTGELARWLGVGVSELVVLADRRGLSRNAVDERWRHYRYRWVPKQSGGVRLIEAPKLRLRTVQRYLLDDIIAHIPPHDACHGFRAGRSVRSFAAPHVGREVVVRLDLHSFFASVFAPRVAAILRAAGYPDGVARTMAALCTHATPRDVLAGVRLDATETARLRTPHLPQGAPTSGALANLAAFGLDVRVAAFAQSIGAVYTRYADDLAISGGRELAQRSSSIIAGVAAIAHDEGFSVNFRKTRVMVRAGRQRIAGVVVNDKLSVARDDIDRLRATLHNCIRTTPAAQNRDGHADFRAHLLGRISWVRSLDPRKGAKLLTMFERIDWR